MSPAEAGAIVVTTTTSDYRDVGGCVCLSKYVESTDLIGRTVYEVERVELGVTLAPEIHAPGTHRIGRRPVRGVLDSERDRIFGEWLAGHKGILFKVVHAYALEHADRQDLFQEIVIQVWRSVDAFRGESSVPTWIYRVALNTAIAWTRKEDRHQRGKQPLAVEACSPRRLRMDTTRAWSGCIARSRSSRTSIAPSPCCSSTASATRRSPPSSASPRATWREDQPDQIGPGIDKRAEQDS